MPRLADADLQAGFGVTTGVDPRRWIMIWVLCHTRRQFRHHSLISRII